MKRQIQNLLLAFLVAGSSLAVGAETSSHNIIKTFAPIAGKPGGGSAHPEDPSTNPDPTPEEPQKASQYLIVMSGHPTQGGCGVGLKGFADAANCAGQVASMGSIDHTDIKVGGIQAVIGRYLIYGNSCLSYLMVTSETPYASFPAQIQLEINGNTRDLKKTMDYYPYTSWVYNNCSDTASINNGDTLRVNLIQ
ncbi:hypothetical protein IFT48_03730 [Pseudomonas fluorescens]|uniref:hypothetical protein n=1 Tax=Pseudomonas TaxID=286 RepID=UPI000F0368F4|nr:MULTISPECIES: hypothetical protein [Pseudomonas]MBD8089080.1 hypothetical protein [Pseudomonas fluorescens]MBD8615494.1 hypothetical protein [Pseudomonas putida]MBD8681853.1 hypothetical protein [Pseudomonas sp. CFBP 13719]